jgi:hypothetical protein
MPVHLALIGAPASGKSYTLSAVLRLMPGEAFHQIDASSPRALIYDAADLQHRTLVFSEADSLPAGEDNPCASAVRNLLQEHRLRYAVPIRDERTGKFETQEIDKAGPTVMLTTAVRPLGEQLGTRVFTIEIGEGADAVRAALNAQAAIELHGTSEPDSALIAFQSMLQAGAPWDVAVPFAARLAEEIGRNPSATRITRDFARLLSFVKSVTVLRHQRRDRDSSGRLVATLDDYRYVYDLLGPTYRATTSGVRPGVRAVVEALESLRADGVSGAVTAKELGEKAGIPNRMSALRYCKTAVQNGWLVNTEIRDRAPLKLSEGEPLPPESGLPKPEALEDAEAVENLVVDEEPAFEEVLV